MAIKCLVFDCDGVLIDSVPVKTKAFARLVEDYGSKKQAAFIQYHIDHGGVSRYQKFAWFFQTQLGRDITEAESKAFGERFQALCLEELKSCPLIPGTLETLQYWAHKIPMYVCSGAPQKEQQSILELKGIAKFFTEILGSPPAKATLLANIVEKAQVAAQNTLMIGDAFTDLEAAKTIGTQFYAVGAQLEHQHSPWSQDLTKLTDYLLQS